MCVTNDCRNSRLQATACSALGYGRLWHHGTTNPIRVEYPAFSKDSNAECMSS
jgi:hypothetical protein